jgi:uncharacterized protein YwgA/O-acetyl-ADP-ribose deacetylase (regulator of RNase III)
MIEVRTGDLLKSRKHALVNTVNCVGVMGKGVALAFKKQYPDMFENYLKRCENHEVRLGEPYPYAAADGHIVVNFPTKDHWRAVSRLSDIVSGLQYLRDHYHEWGIRSLAVPPLGCGNGQLEWRVVGPTLHRELSKLPIPIELYAPAGTPFDEMQLSFFESPSSSDIKAHPDVATLIEPSWVALADVLRHLEERRFHWPVGRVRFQKIAYFLATLGVPLKLEYERGSYGPYSPSLKSITARLLNNGLLEETQSGRMIEVTPGPTYGDARAAYESALSEWEPAVERVTDLFSRMRSDQAEVSASVHLVATELAQKGGRKPTEVEVRDEVLRWRARRRPPLQPHAVEDAITGLAMHGWIDVAVSPELHDDDQESERSLIG